tara:strand:+ start:97 stop:375 length:279 start_codon:yes stop_codon:yes gene_type:complete
LIKDKLHEKDKSYTYHGYRFIGQWDEEKEIYNNEILSPDGNKFINHNNSMDGLDFNRVTSVDVCATTKNTLTIKEFARIINRWEEFIKNGYR